MKKSTVRYSIEHSYFQTLQIDTSFSILEMKEENLGKFVFMHFKLRFISFDSMLDILFFTGFVNFVFSPSNYSRRTQGSSSCPSILKSK